MMEQKKLSVVMPAYNEEAVIYENLMKTNMEIGEFCSSYEIICVNDGSVDNTKNEIDRAVNECQNIVSVTYNKNAGKGHAIKQGVQQASGEYIAFLDSDLDLAPDHLKDFMEQIQQQKADIVIGSKMHPDSKLEYPLVRKVLSGGYYCILLLLFRLKIHDTQTGVKLFDGKLLKQIVDKVETEGYAYDIEILAIANEMGAKIIERPITLHFTRNNGFGRIKVKDIIKMFDETVHIKCKLIKMRKMKENLYT